MSTNILYLYLGDNNHKYTAKLNGTIDVTINVTKELYNRCNNFEVVKHYITFPGLENDTSETTSLPCYDLYIYSGRYHGSKPELVLSYYPLESVHTVKQVDSYYVLYTEILIALVFTTRDGKKCYYTYDQLKSITTLRRLNGTLIDDNLCSRLLAYCKTSSKLKTLQFTLLSNANQGVCTNERNIGNDNKFKKVIFTPDPKVEQSRFLLKSSNLFTYIPDGGLINEIDQSSLDKIRDKPSNAVIVYYTGSDHRPKNLAILIEFLIDCNKIHIKRASHDPPIWLHQQVYYEHDTGLIEQLGYIKEESESSLTYKLEKNKNADGYTDGRINVTEENITPDPLYKIYTHIPSLGGVRNFLSYNNKEIVPVSNPGIQDIDRPDKDDGDSFSKISTYVLSDNYEEHLLIRLTSSKGINYYMHRFSRDGNKWKQLSISDLKEAGIEESPSLEGNLNQKLDKLLEEKLQSTNVKKLLTQISLSVNSIFLLLDNKSSYSSSEINTIITSEMTLIENDDNVVEVTDCTHSNGDFASNGYKVYKHDLTQAVRVARLKLNTNKLYLRFCLDTHKIDLDDNEIETGEPKYLSYSDENNNLYVYFYGDRDPRPLLFCYGGTVYIPKDLASYAIRWAKEQNIKNCFFQKSDQNKDLLSALSRVVGFLNVVELKRATRDFTDASDLGTEEPNYESDLYGTYSVQRFTDDISIKVTHKNQTCYRIYTHTPNGTGDDNGGSYRLGNIKYDSTNQEPNGLEYQSSDPLSTVSAYYHVHDQHHNYPFLVVLDFKVNGGTTYKEYYKLKDKGKKVWVKMVKDSKDRDILKKLENSEKIEDGLYELRSELGIEFKGKNIIPLFRDDECKEEKINIAAIAGGTVGTAAVVGTGVTIGVVVSKNLAATAVAAAAATTVAL